GGVNDTLQTAPCRSGPGPGDCAVARPLPATSSRTPARFAATSASDIDIPAKSGTSCRGTSSSASTTGCASLASSGSSTVGGGVTFAAFFSLLSLSSPAATNGSVGGTPSQRSASIITSCQIGPATLDPWCDPYGSSTITYSTMRGF